MRSKWWPMRFVRARAEISDPNRPIGSFIFLDQQVWEKLKLAKAFAEFLFDDEQSLVRIDMSEYMEKHSVCSFDRGASGICRL